MSFVFMQIKVVLFGALNNGDPGPNATGLKGIPKAINGIITSAMYVDSVTPFITAKLVVDFLYVPFVREPTISPIREVIPTGLKTKVRDEIKVVMEVNICCLPVKILSGLGK